MKKIKSWFEVDKNGLAQLMAGKPKSFILRELIQNAWDENIRKCIVDIKYKNDDNVIEISVEDDSPEGFKDITHAYTLYADTYKRSDVKKRGRFNTGEKLAFSVCKNVVVETTKGTIIFDESGRHESDEKRKNGSIITVWFDGTQDDYNNIIQSIDKYLIPKGITFTINNKEYKYKTPIKVFKALLLSEIKNESTGIVGRTRRSTDVHVIKNDTDDASHIYEMGIPIQEIDGSFHLDVQQKVPLDQSRESVLPSFLKDLYAVALDNIHEDIDEDESAETWITEGMKGKNVSKEALHDVITKRYGDKVVVADNFDPNSIDDAISHGYKVLRGTELPKDVWSNTKKFNLIPSSSRLFGHRTKCTPTVEPNEKQRLVALYAKKIAKRCIGIDIEVQFIDDRHIVPAEFNRNNIILTFNLGKLPINFFDEPLKTTGLILHELAHFNGNHTQSSYHKLLTEIGEKLVIIALKEPEFFRDVII